MLLKGIIQCRFDDRPSICAAESIKSVRTELYNFEQFENQAGGRTAGRAGGRRAGGGRTNGDKELQGKEEVSALVSMVGAQTTNTIQLWQNAAMAFKW